MYSCEPFERELLQIEENYVLGTGLFTVRININVLQSHLKYMHTRYRSKGEKDIEGKTLPFVAVRAHFSKVDNIYLKKKSPMHF